MTTLFFYKKFNLDIFLDFMKHISKTTSFSVGWLLFSEYIHNEDHMMPKLDLFGRLLAF